MYLSFMVLLISTEYILSSSTTVQLLGLFPEHQNLTTLHRIPQASAMFKVAVELANRYGMTANNQSIGYITLETSGDGDGLVALNQVCRQLMSSNIIGIVGPAASSEDRVLGPFTARLNLPMVSYAATSPEIPSNTFYRLVPSDKLLSMAITKLFVLFAWRSCIMIVQEDGYGYGGIKLISENYSQNVNITDQIVFDTHKQEFQVDVREKLKRSRSRIVLVWADQDATTSIVRKAMQLGLLDSEFVWILTNRVAQEMFTSNETQKLIGLLTIEPMHERRVTINMTLLNDSYALWQEREPATFPGTFNVSNYALRVFDATWAILLALHNALSTPSLPKDTSYCFDAHLTQTDEYFRQLTTSKFLGVSGEVELSRNNTNNRVHDAWFVLSNIQSRIQQRGKKKEVLYVPVLKFCNSIGARWMNYTVEDEIQTAIVWPNAMSTVPLDHPVIKGEILKIGVIEMPPFIIVTNTSSTSNVSSNDIVIHDDQHLLTGFLPEIIRLLKENMGFELRIYLISPTMGYNGLVEGVRDGLYNIGIADLTITSNRLQMVHFSTPFHETNTRLFVRHSATPSAFDLLSYLRPIAWPVWLMTLAVVLYSGILIYLFERENNANSRDGRWYSDFGISVFRALSSSIEMSRDSIPTTGATRMLSLALTMLYFILLATYTANLSAFLTLKWNQPSITGIDDIKNGHVPYSKIGIVQNSSYADFYVQHISSQFYPVHSLYELFDRLLDKTIDAGLYGSTALEYGINRYHCGKLTAVGLGFTRVPYGIAMPKDWLHKTELDAFLLKLHEKGTIASLEARWFRTGTCKNGKTLEDEGGEGINIEVLAGLFVMFFIMSIAAIMIHIWRRCPPRKMQKERL